jgi:hypothetical protein
MGMVKKGSEIKNKSRHCKCSFFQHNQKLTIKIFEPECGHKVYFELERWKCGVSRKVIQLPPH